MNKVFMIEEVYCSCREYDLWNYEIHTEYGFFRTLEDAKEFIKVNNLPSLFANEEGYRPVEILEHKEEV